MHISCVYLSTYSQDKPISGHMDIKDDSTQFKIDFSPDEAASIQSICVSALERMKAEAAAKLLSADIAVPQLEAPKKSIIEDGDFEEIR